LDAGRAPAGMPVLLPPGIAYRYGRKPRWAAGFACRRSIGRSWLMRPLGHSEFPSCPNPAKWSQIRPPSPHRTREEDIDSVRSVLGFDP
jgi:hypothetical protein